LSKLLRANTKPLETIALSDLDPPLAETRFLGANRPQRTRSGRVLEGTSKEKAEALLALLKEKALIS
jgi:electron transfer flavoprotein alpha/beta subunit